MNRRGEDSSLTVGQVISLIIGAVLFLVLVFLGGSIIGPYINSDEKDAISFLDDLNGKINALNEGQNYTFSFLGAEDYVLVGFNVDDSIRPEQCFLSSCLCLCKDGRNCNDNDVCKLIDRNVSVHSSATVNLEFEYEDVIEGSYANMTASCYYKYETSDALFIDKKRNLITIFSDYGVLLEENKYYSLRAGMELCPDYVSAAQSKSFRIN